ncbi:MAG: hypothetical protein ACKOFE_00225 [Bacteroidota bacterium]
MSNRMTRTILGYGTALALGLWLGIFLQNQRKDPQASNTKMDWIRHLVNTRYVDSLPTDSLVNASIQPFLSSLALFLRTYLPLKNRLPTKSLKEISRASGWNLT